MFEDTNQIIENTDTAEESYDDFSDIFSEEVSEEPLDTNEDLASENVPAADEEVESTEPPADTKPETFTVRFNGQDLSLSREELIKNAQKGLNYDHVLQQ